MNQSTSSEIILYDIPFAKSEAWSPNTWKTRYSLNFKCLPYHTQWVEYPDIEPLCVKLGAEPTDIKDDGISPEYTFPVIYDPTTNKVISESFKIAQYLDETYPDTPRLLPEGTVSLQRAYARMVPSRVAALQRFIAPAVNRKLGERSEEFYRRTREARFGMTLEEVEPKGKEREIEWRKVEEGFGRINGYVSEGELWMMGERISFADFVTAGLVQWCKHGFGRESEEWKDVERWNGGKWGKLLESLKEYEMVV